MSASVVTICNLALAHLGDEANVSSISPPDGSAQAAHCSRFYPVARDTLLEMHNWDFSIQRVALAMTARTPPGAWDYEYALPATCLRPLAVLDAEASDESDSYDYIIEADDDGNRVILCNVENAYLRYVVQVTDTTKFSALFVNALSYLLASYLAGPILKSPEAKRAMYESFLAELGKAGVNNANSARRDPVHTPDFVAVRGFVNPFLADGRIIR